MARGRLIDLLFLDIQMPNLSGVSLARLPEKGPRVIFTTAYQQYALEGYKTGLQGMGLKPYLMDIGAPIATDTFPVSRAAGYGSPPPSR